MHCEDRAGERLRKTKIYNHVSTKEIGSAQRAGRGIGDTRARFCHSLLYSAGIALLFDAEGAAEWYHTSLWANLTKLSFFDIPNACRMFLRPPRLLARERHRRIARGDQALQLVFPECAPPCDGGRSNQVFHVSAFSRPCHLGVQNSHTARPSPAPKVFAPISPTDQTRHATGHDPTHVCCQQPFDHDIAQPDCVTPNVHCHAPPLSN